MRWHTRHATVHSDIYQLISMYDWIFSFFFAPSISSKVLMAFLLNWNCLYCEELLVVIWKYHLVLCWTSWEKMSCRRTWTRSPNIYIRRVKMLDTKLMFKLFFFSPRKYVRLCLIGSSQLIIVLSILKINVD